MTNLKFAFEKINLTSYNRTTVYAPRVQYGRSLVDRMHYIHKGNEYISFKGQEYVLEPDIFYYFPHQLKYKMHYDSDGCDHSYVDFIPSRPIICDNIIKFEPNVHPLLYSTLSLIFSYAVKFPKTDGIGNLYYDNIISNYMLCFFDILDKEDILHPSQNPTINLVLDYIHKNLQKKITVKELSEIAHMEENSFSRYFKRYISYPPYYYIKLHRFNMAVNLIEQKHSISEVADFLGYSSVANFSKAFKNHYGYYPTQIKKHGAESLY